MNKIIILFFILTLSSCAIHKGWGNNETQLDGLYNTNIGGINYCPTKYRININKKLWLDKWKPTNYEIKTKE